MASKLTYKDMINGETPTLVDFTASWCGPCKAMAPVLQKASNELGEKGRIIKVDVDKNPGEAQRMQVRSVPTLVLYHKGKNIMAT